MQTRYLTKADLALLKKREHVAFPCHDETSPERQMSAYLQWIDAERNLSLVFEDEGEIKGFICIIPVNKQGWNYVIDDEINDVKEYDLKDDLLYHPAKKQQLGLYVYMIEKLDKSIQFFTKQAYQAVFKKIKQQFEPNPFLPEPTLLGITGYSVSPQAINVAMNKLARSEVKPLNMFMFYDPQGELVALEVNSVEEFNNFLDQGYKMRNRCRMLAVTPNDPSPVWRWFADAQ